MVDKKVLTEKESRAASGIPSKKETKVSAASGKKLRDLKIELLKNPTKRKSIKKEIARLLTMENRTKLDEGKK